MTCKNIEDAVDKGYELRVERRSRSRDFHASVWLGDGATGHNFIGQSVESALIGLDRYLGEIWRLPDQLEGDE